MVVPYATITDVSTRLGRPITDPSEVAQVEAWIGDIESLILARFPELNAAVDAGTPTAATVVMVESNAVIRKIRNPDGKQNERIDDYSYGLNEDARRGELFLTDEEWSLLIPRSTGGAWTITPYGASRRRGQWVHPDVWVPLP